MGLCDGVGQGSEPVRPYSPVLLLKEEKGRKTIEKFQIFEYTPNIQSYFTINFKLGPSQLAN